MPIKLLQDHTVACLEPALRDYAWGDPSAIPDLLGLRPTGRPCAEAWFGAHARASATVGGRDLGELIEADPVHWLGHSVRDRFGGLPYLLKLLAARRPLSVQAHPDSEQARAGWAREERAGIAVDARHRCYPDPFAKPELLVALTPFELLAGVRPAATLRAALDDAPEIRSLLPDLSAVGVQGWVAGLLALPDAVLEPALRHWLARDPTSLAARCHTRLEGPPDRGLVFTLLLEPVHLQPGQGVYLAPGMLHAYIEGTALEIAGSSDNVLRAGLTAKHVEPQELLRVVRWDARPRILSPVAPGESYDAGADAFVLHRHDLRPRVRTPRIANGPETLLALPRRGDVLVRIFWREGHMDLPQGRACLVPHGVAYELEATGPAQVFRASVPV